MTIPTFEEIIGHNDQIAARAEHLSKLEALIGNVYPNKFERSSITGGEDTISAILDFEPVKNLVPQFAEGERPTPELKNELNTKLKEFGNVRVAGRMATPPRLMGKAAFVHLSDGVSRLQIYVRRDDVQGVFNGENQSRKDAENENSKSKIQNPKSVNGWELFNLLDHGDFIGVEGFLFITNTGELSIHVETLQFLAKALLPMPDKMHGIEDAETKQRRRYLDLIASSLQIQHEGLTTREVFERRAKFISGMRNYLDAHDYIEVETPMLTPKATGAAAKPFVTHHNALDITLYARIAPELYLKRLVVGGFEKVYELNRNFRNEGISTRHNPEFTMLEFYCAYMDVNGMMDFAEKMIRDAVLKATGGLQIKFGETEIDFSKFDRLTMKEAVRVTLCPPNASYSLNDYVGQTIDSVWLDNPENLRALVLLFYKYKAIEDKIKDQPREARLYDANSKEYQELLERKIKFASKLWQESLAEVREQQTDSAESPEQAARDLLFIFENGVEPFLIQPTFITDYPKIISPLSKASPTNPQIAERFELFINGMECANGFSELNAPQEQFERFLDQMRERERGDEEAMVLDEDYIRALAYGMPPAAGIGIGIDRLVMLLTNRHSIRDVILFPHMRPERSQTQEEES